MSVNVTIAALFQAAAKRRFTEFLRERFPMTFGFPSQNSCRSSTAQARVSFPGEA